MKTEKQNVGRRGEDAACEYLLKAGHLIVERNRRASHLETDIISLDSAGLHFVEVKTRTAPTTADPEVNVDKAKMRRMVRAANSYLHAGDKPWTGDTEVFFDVITVILDGDDAIVEYYPQAFIPVYV